MGRFSRGHFCVMIDRGDYWQCGYLISKGTDAALRAAGIEELQRRFAGLLPWMADRVGELTSWDDVHLLDVRLERLRRWDLDGLLLIGDAAHAMSPVGGVGINLAVADAVAAARLLAPALRGGRDPVPRPAGPGAARRWWPTALIQGGQRLAHRAVLGRALNDPSAAMAATARHPGAHRTGEHQRLRRHTGRTDGHAAAAAAPGAALPGAAGHPGPTGGHRPAARARTRLGPPPGRPPAPRAPDPPPTQPARRVERTSPSRTARFRASELQYGSEVRDSPCGCGCGWGG